jgi:hypothetical protein
MDSYYENRIKQLEAVIAEMQQQTELLALAAEAKAEEVVIERSAIFEWLRIPQPN